MAKIAPSILAADFANLERDIRDIEENGADWVHVDVMDGLFVPNISIGIPVVKAIRPVTGLPLDVHLMIDRPIRYVDGFCKAGASILSVHLEADTPEGIREALARTRALGVRSALALKPGTPAEAALPYLELCDMILVMTVEPGFSGQTFMADMMPKLQTIHHWVQERGLPCILEVDGGVGPSTFQTCLDHGADLLVAGSAYFRAPDRDAFVKMLQGGRKELP